MEVTARGDQGHLNTRLVHCNLVITLTIGAKRKERYNEIGLALVGYSASSTGRSCDIQNNCNVFHTSFVQHRRLQFIGHGHLGWLSD